MKYGLGRYWIVVACVAAFTTHAFASEKAAVSNPFGYGCYHCKSDIFDGVTKAYVYVHYIGAGSRKEQADLPAPLRKENIENLLYQMFTHRFSSKDCKNPLEPKGRWFEYGCNNQPVILVTDGKGRRRMKEDTEPGTLHVIFEIRIEATESTPNDGPWTN